LDIFVVQPAFSAIIEIMVDLARRLSELPGDLFSIKSTYSSGFQAVALSDYSAGAVVLGKAGERMA
jgi:hypothetical protein